MCLFVLYFFPEMSPGIFTYALIGLSTFCTVKFGNFLYSGHQFFVVYVACMYFFLASNLFFQPVNLKI